MADVGTTCRLGGRSHCLLGVLRRCCDAVPPSRDSSGLTCRSTARVNACAPASSLCWHAPACGGVGCTALARPPLLPPPSLLGARAMRESMIAMEHGTYSTSSCGTAVRVPARMWLLLLMLLKEGAPFLPGGVWVGPRSVLLPIPHLPWCMGRWASQCGSSHFAGWIARLFALSLQVGV